MYRILQKEVLSPAIKSMVIEAPHVARAALPGQFIILRINEEGERIPLTIADFNREEGTVTIVFQEVGKSTMHLGTLNPGDKIATFAGPLGHPSEIEYYGKVICIAGGVGIAPIYPIAKALKEKGNYVISILGARGKGLLFWEEKMKKVSNELIICTDDGSYGRKGVVTEPLKEILNSNSSIARVWAIGPAIMMKYVSLVTKPFNVHTIVSLNPIMIDGTGMCGGCRVIVGDESRFVCVDGPEFNAHVVNWDNLLTRLQFYKKEESIAVEHWAHKCRLDS
ncbi:MAG: sulfide/dihydroorotate dehydrogenase-like FAD/NAD-binding protein [Thermodesulfovibrionales bacterium]